MFLFLEKNREIYVKQVYTKDQVSPLGEKWHEVPKGFIKLVSCFKLRYKILKDKNVKNC